MYKMASICKRGATMMKSSLIRINLIFILLILLIPNLTSAESKTFIKEYTYQASEEDSRNSSRTIALREVKRLLLEELGTYLESITEVQNFQLTKDQITTLTAGIVQTNIVEEKWDGHTYWLKSKIAADSGDVIKSIDALHKDRQKTKELEELRKRSEDLLKENERLRKELTVAKGEKRQQTIADYDENIKYLTANEWFEKGYASHTSGNYNDAINAYSKAIELNPKLAMAYNNRGNAYYMLGNHRQAIHDLDKAIELDPKLALAYHNRGLAYNGLGNYNQAIHDLDKAIELDPKFAGAYVARGIVYVQLRNRKQALNDFNRAIKVDPKFAPAYASRGIVYIKLRNRKQELNDYNRAIEVDPKFAPAYYFRGNYYRRHGNKELAMQDFKMAARLGDQDAQNFLKAEGIDWSSEGVPSITSSDKPAQKPEKKDEFSSSATSPDKTQQKPIKNVEPSTVADDLYKKIKAIVLMNGNSIEGKILSWNPDIVKILTKDGKVLSYDFKKEVQTFITE
jgi:tetratricopeptide (TPR) repeat protein